MLVVQRVVQLHSHMGAWLGHSSQTPDLKLVQWFPLHEQTAGEQGLTWPGQSPGHIHMLKDSIWWSGMWIESNEIALEEPPNTFLKIVLETQNDGGEMKVLVTD